MSAQLTERSDVKLPARIYPEEPAKIHGGRRRIHHKKGMEMKRLTALFLMILILGTALPVLAMNPQEEEKAHRQEMKAVKDKQRAEKEAKKLVKAKDKEGPHEKSFWEKEGERSGLGNSGNGVGQFIKKLNPAPFFKDQNEKYKARKAKQQ